MKRAVVTDAPDADPEDPPIKAPKAKAYHGNCYTLARAWHGCVRVLNRIPADQLTHVPATPDDAEVVVEGQVAKEGLTTATLAHPDADKPKRTVFTVGTSDGRVYILFRTWSDTTLRSSIAAADALIVHQRPVAGETMYVLALTEGQTFTVTEERPGQPVYRKTATVTIVGGQVTCNHKEDRKVA